MVDAGFTFYSCYEIVALLLNSYPYLYPSRRNDDVNRFNIFTIPRHIDELARANI